MKYMLMMNTPSGGPYQVMSLAQGGHLAGTSRS